MVSKLYPACYQLNSVGKCQCLSQLGMIRCGTKWESNVEDGSQYDIIIMIINYKQRNVTSVGTCPVSYRENNGTNAHTLLRNQADRFFVTPAERSVFIITMLLFKIQETR